MSDCPIKPYCNEDCTACTDADKAEKIDRFVEALQPIVASIVEVLTPAMQEAKTAINNMWRSVIECYPNRRVVHLALHHRKKKIRKKNTNRIIFWLRE
jgi:hypothetical protein